MTVRHAAVSRVSTAIVMLALVVAAACKKIPPAAPGEAPPPPPVIFKLSLSAAADVNPDTSGRPSPIVVRVYQLKNDVAFKNSDFFALYDNDKTILGADLIAREEFILTPGENKGSPVTVPGTAKFLGVIAAYRDVRAAEWRLLLPAPFPKTDMVIAVERARVVLR